MLVLAVKAGCQGHACSNWEPCGSRELIPPGTLAHIQRAAIVQPIIATKGKHWKGRLILVDHFQRKHKTQRIEFKWDGGPQAKVNLTKGRAQFKSEGGWRALVWIIEVVQNPSKTSLSLAVLLSRGATCCAPKNGGNDPTTQILPTGGWVTGLQSGGDGRASGGEHGGNLCFRE